jgi:hypothetical protein
MKIQEIKYLKSCGCIDIIAVVLLIMSIVVTGCTQTSSDTSGQSPAALSPTDTSGNSAPAQGAGSAAPSGAYANHQHTGGNFLTNETRLAAAAQTLGVSENDLTSALTPTQGAHFNLTTAAAQLSAASGITITADQLRAALGMSASGVRNGTWQGSGQNAAVNGRNTPSGNTSPGQ